MSSPYKNKWTGKFDAGSESPVESWTTSYGDLMTILLVFFVLLISATHVSAIKFERIKRAFQGATDEESIALVLEKLEQQIAEADLGHAVDVNTDGNSIEITFHDQLLFDLGRDEVKPDGMKVLEQFAATLQALPEYARLAIEGYTDDNPVNPTVYDSNWHLSALRSLSVLKILEKMKVCADNCEIRGFGEYRSAAPNRDQEGKPIAENQSVNRRVVLRIF